jgi:hypothetical protein
MMRAGNNLALAVISATRAMLASAASGATHVRPTRRAGVRVRWMVFCERRRLLVGLFAKPGTLAATRHENRARLLEIDAFDALESGLPKPSQMRVETA